MPGGNTGNRVKEKMGNENDGIYYEGAGAVVVKVKNPEVATLGFFKLVVTVISG